MHKLISLLFSSTCLQWHRLLVILEAHVTSMGEILDQTNTFQNKSFNMLQNHITTLEELSGNVSLALHGAVAVAHGHIEQAQQEMSSRISHFVRQRLTAMLGVLESAVEEILTSAATAARNDIADSVDNQVLFAPQHQQESIKEMRVRATATTIRVQSAARQGDAVLEEVINLFIQLEQCLNVAASVEQILGTDTERKRAETADMLLKAKRVCQRLRSGCATMMYVSESSQNAIPLVSKEISDGVTELRDCIDRLTSTFRQLDTTVKYDGEGISTILVDESMKHVDGLTEIMSTTAANELGSAVDATSDVVDLAAQVADNIQNLATQISSHIRILRSGIEGAVHCVKRGRRKVRNRIDSLRTALQTVRHHTELVKEQATNSNATTVDGIGAAEKLQQQLVDLKAQVRERSQSAIDQLSDAAEMQEATVLLRGLIKVGGGGNGNGSSTPDTDSLLNRMITICLNDSNAIVQQHAEELRSKCKSHFNAKADELQKHALHHLETTQSTSMNALQAGIGSDRIKTKVQKTKTVCIMLSSKCTAVVRVTTAGQHVVPTKQDMRNTVLDLKLAVTDLTKELHHMNMKPKGVETVWDELVNSATSEIQKLTQEVGNTIAGELGNSINAASDTVNQAAVCADKIHGVTLKVGSHLRVLSSGISSAVSSIEHALSKLESSRKQLKSGIEYAKTTVQHVKKRNQNNGGAPSVERIGVQKQLERRLLEVEELVVDQIRVMMSAVGASENVQQKKAEMQRMNNIFRQTKNVLHGLLQQAKTVTTNNCGQDSAGGGRESGNGSLDAVLAICGKVGESMARRAQELRQACEKHIREAATKLQQHATKFLANAARDAMDAVGMSSEQGKQIMAEARNIAKFALRTFDDG
jgi:hypothetical protein